MSPQRIQLVRTRVGCIRGKAAREWDRDYPDTPVKKNGAGDASTSRHRGPFLQERNRRAYSINACRGGEAVTWIKLDDQFSDHPKFLTLTDAAVMTWIRGLCYCSRYLTDGAIPKAMLARGIGSAKSARDLVEAGLWEATADGWQVHNYTEHQRSSAEIEAEREKWRKKKQGQRMSPGDTPRDSKGESPESPSTRDRDRDRSLGSSTSSSLLLCVDGSEREPRVVQAIELLGRQDSDEATDVRNKKAHLSACIETRACRDGHALDIFAEQYPELDAEGLAQEFASGF